MAFNEDASSLSTPSDETTSQQGTTVACSFGCHPRRRLGVSLGSRFRVSTYMKTRKSQPEMENAGARVVAKGRTFYKLKLDKIRQLRVRLIEWLKRTLFFYVTRLNEGLETETQGHACCKDAS